MKTKTGNFNAQHPNFWQGGHLWLVRCFAPVHGEGGLENYALAVQSGICHSCGWPGTKAAPGLLARNHTRSKVKARSKGKGKRKS